MTLKELEVIKPLVDSINRFTAELAARNALTREKVAAAVNNTAAIDRRTAAIENQTLAIEEANRLAREAAARAALPTAA